MYDYVYACAPTGTLCVKKSHLGIVTLPPLSSTGLSRLCNSHVYILWRICLVKKGFCCSCSGDHSDLVKSSGAVPLNPKPVPATANQTPLDTTSASKPELLPANLVDLTVRQA